jgi:hypothetical protein
MALTELNKNLDIIAKLADEPNDVGGLGADQLKAKFDEAGNLIKEYINKSLIPEIESDIDAAAQGVGSGGGIDGSRLVNSSVPDSKIKNISGTKIDDGTITTQKHVKGSITRELLAEDAKALQTEDFPNKVVPQRALADQSVSTVKLEDGAVNEDKVNPSSRTQHWTLTVGTNWTGDVAPFAQEIDAPGMRSTDIPKTYFKAPDDFANLEAWQEAYGMLYETDSADGSITIYAKEKTTVAITVLVEVSRI